MAKDLIIKVGDIIDVHSARRLAPVIPEPEDPNKGDIVTYIRKNKVTKVGDGEDDYVIEEIVVEDSRVNRQAFIEKDKDDVGVLNILEKVRRSGDVTLLNQTGATIPEGLQDYTNVPSSVQEALAVVSQGQASFEGLKAIFGDISFSDLASMSADQIQAALNAYVAAQSAPAEGGNE